MSHVATIDIEVRDLDDLSAACGRLGLELVRGQETYRWYGYSVGNHPIPDGFTAEDFGKCEHAIRIPEGHPARRSGYGECYEIGVVRRRDGRPGYTLIWDYWDPQIRQAVGVDGIKLRQFYAVAAAQRQAMRSGFRVQERVASDGSIQLICSK